MALVASLSIPMSCWLTDAGLTSLVQANTLLLTDDLDLYVSAVSAGGDAINFTHMHEAAGTV